MTVEKERRQLERVELGCPITLVASGGVSEIHGRTLDINDGGACFVPAEGRMPNPGQKFKMKLALPRQNANTYFLEHFVGSAEVVWMEESAEGKDGGWRIAIRFIPEISLDIQ
ncbi:MAG: PilZ domain-containing protein [Phycisphaerae bacterium]|nr:PilZ domain-containing protein [Phycisphaerae bacterium]